MINNTKLSQFYSHYNILNSNIHKVTINDRQWKIYKNTYSLSISEVNLEIELN